MIQGINHITLGVRNLDRSIRFYQDALGFRLAARWLSGAYLSAGRLWLALALDHTTSPAIGETHVAFTVAQADFDAVRSRIQDAGAPEWRANTSEGASLYFCDPDGHQLEIHVGSLASRLASLQGREGYVLYS